MVSSEETVALQSPAFNQVNLVLCDPLLRTIQTSALKRELMIPEMLSRLLSFSACPLFLLLSSCFNFSSCRPFFWAYYPSWHCPDFLSRSFFICLLVFDRVFSTFVHFSSLSFGSAVRSLHENPYLPLIFVLLHHHFSSFASCPGSRMLLLVESHTCP